MRKEKQYQLAKTQSYHPVHKKRYPPKRQQSNNGSPVNGRFFQGNLAQNMRFGGKDHNLSGYVQRTVVMKKGNEIMVAKEKQFFNSSKNQMRVRIKDDEKD